MGQPGNTSNPTCSSDQAMGVAKSAAKWSRPEESSGPKPVANRFSKAFCLCSRKADPTSRGKTCGQKGASSLKEQVHALRADLEDPDSFMAMTNLVEQACNRYLQTDLFPTTYEDLQPVPVLSVGQLTFAGDDGMKLGQTYRARIEAAQCCDLATHTGQKRATLTLKLRTPDDRGK